MELNWAICMDKIVVLTTVLDFVLLILCRCIPRKDHLQLKEEDSLKEMIYNKLRKKERRQTHPISFVVGVKGQVKDQLIKNKKLLLLLLWIKMN